MTSVWSIRDIRESDLANIPTRSAKSEMYFPDQENPLEVIGESSYMSQQTDFFFGILLYYDYQVGQGKKQGQYGAIFKVEFKSGHGYSTSIINTWTK